ncbi:MAG: radical SAM protein [Burkholderiaceae bacterium]
MSSIRVVRGRGAVSNPAGRFETVARSPIDDGWPGSGPDTGRPAPATEIRTIPVRSAITYNRSPDIAFDRALNPYRGCEHGCIYCYARPTHAFDGLSPGLDFETRIGVRAGMAAVLARELDAPGYRCDTVNIGSVTDPYQPAERQHGLTRELLRELVRRSHPFTIVTKGALIERDIDLIGPAARRGLAKCFMSISTLEPALARLWDARASAPWRRLRAVRTLVDAGIPVGVIAAPIAPFLNDHEIERLVEAAAQAGAQTIHYTILRLPGEVRPLFLAWLATHFPDRHDRVLAGCGTCAGASA